MAVVSGCDPTVVNGSASSLPVTVLAIILNLSPNLNQASQEM